MTALEELIPDHKKVDREGNSGIEFLSKISASDNPTEPSMTMDLNNFEVEYL